MAVLEIAREFRTSDSGRTPDERLSAEILSASPFSDVEQISVEVERTWTVDQLIAHLASRVATGKPVTLSVRSGRTVMNALMAMQKINLAELERAAGRERVTA